MAVISKKDEKANMVIASMTDKQSEDEFKRRFKEMFPEDYVKIVKTYEKEERKTKKDKSHPMPHPDKYLSNMYKVAIKHLSD